MKKILTWLPIAYFQQGAPYALIASLSVLFYHYADLSNTKATLYSSLLLLPWALKPLWVAYLERCQNRRFVLLLCQGILIPLYVGIALTLTTEFMLISSLLFFMLIAFISASYDSLSDGFYLQQLNFREQTHYIGIKTLAYQLARISVQGGLLLLLGYWMKEVTKLHAWQRIFIVLAASTTLLWLWQYVMLPNNRDTNTTTPARHTLVSVIRQFLTLPGIGVFLLFAFFYNMPEAQLQRVLPLFLVDKNGGALSAWRLGMIYGVGGTGAYLLGVFLMGLLARFQRQLLGFTLLTILSNMGYLLLICCPETRSVLVMSIIVIFAQFCFGLSNTIYMIYLLKKVNGQKQQMSYYAFLTAIMALSFSIFGTLSGKITELLSYPYFFIWIIAAGFLFSFGSVFLIRNEKL